MISRPSYPIRVAKAERRSRWSFISLALWFAALPALADLRLTRDGESDYRIVIPADAIPSESYAAQELQSYLAKISGAKLLIVKDSEPEERHEIVLGNTTRNLHLGQKGDLEQPGPEGFEIVTVGDRLFIRGGRTRGTLYGVYTLLEEKLGVRWFTPEVELAPTNQNIRLPDLGESKTPALESRDVFWREMMRDADFAARHRLNGQHYSLSEKHGGPFTVYHPFVHSFDLLIPPALFVEHPEYFPWIDGRRRDGYVQRCLTNPEVLKLSIRRVREWLRDHPEATIVSVSQNDTGNWCHCEKCREIDEREGSPAATLLLFVNAIAQDIERDHPGLFIDTLAYQYTRKPPRTIRPRKNVIVRLCSIECCFAHPLDGCVSPENRKFQDDIVAWRPVAPRLYVWDYTPNFAHYQQPFPNWDALQPNVVFFVKHGVKGLFEQGNYSAGGQGELGPLRAYVLAKLLWNPETDVQRHIREFCQAYYGQAAGGIHAYLDLLCAQVKDPETHAHIFDNSKVAYLDDSFLKRAEQILGQAQEAAENDQVRFRVQVTRLPVWYVELATGRVQGAERKALLNRFLEVGRRTGISNISEGQSLEEWAKKMSD